MKFLNKLIKKILVLCIGNDYFEKKIFSWVKKSLVIKKLNPK